MTENTDWEEWNPSPELTAIPNYEDLPIYKGSQEYFSIDALNWSTLSRFLKNPSYFQRYPNWKFEAKGFGLGTFVHRMFLEEDIYKDKYQEFIAPENPKTGEPYKAGKAYQEAVEAFNSKGFLAIPENGLNILEEIKYSLKAVKLDKYLNGKHETPIIINYDDELKLKGKIDIYSQEYGIIDLKTIATSLNVNGNDYYRWKIKEYSYVEELAFYATIVKLATGHFPPCSLLVVQTSIPYQVGFYEIAPELIERTSETILNQYVPAWKEYKTSGKVPELFTKVSIDYL